MKFNIKDLMETNKISLNSCKIWHDLFSAQKQSTTKVQLSLFPHEQHLFQGPEHIED